MHAVVCTWRGSRGGSAGCGGRLGLAGGSARSSCRWFPGYHDLGTGVGLWDIALLTQACTHSCMHACMHSLPHSSQRDVPGENLFSVLYIEILASMTQVRCG